MAMMMWWSVVVALVLCGCAGKTRHDLERGRILVLSNGLYAVLTEAPDSLAALAALAAAGVPGPAILRNDGRYVGATDAPVEWLALSPRPFVPFVLEREPELGRSENGFASLQLALAPESARILEEFTTEHLNTTVAIVIGGEVITKHKVKAVITGGQLQITRCGDSACGILRTKLLNQQD